MMYNSQPRSHFTEMYSSGSDWPIQYEKPDRIREFQNKKLRAMIDKMYRYQPYCRRTFQENNIDPSSIKTVEDLEKVPLSKKEDLLKDPMDFVLRTPEYKPAFWLMTSGTTENPGIVYLTPYDLDILVETSFRERLVHGTSSKDVVLVTFPSTVHLSFWKGLFGAFAIGCLPVLPGGLGTEKALSLCKVFKVTEMWSVPSYILHFINIAKENGIRLPDLNRVILTGEKISEDMYEKVKKGMDELDAKVSVKGSYGATEMRCAYNECSPFSGYHTYPDFQIVEIVDPKTGKQMEPGESGAIAITDLDGGGSVLLRYLPGDIAKRGITYGKCESCGRTVPRILGPIERLQDYSTKINLINIKGTTVNLNIITDLLSSTEGIEEYFIEIYKNPTDLSDELVVYLAIEKDVERDKIFQLVTKRIKTETEITPKVVFSDLLTLVEKIGGGNKAKRVVDLRDK